MKRLHIDTGVASVLIGVNFILVSFSRALILLVILVAWSDSVRGHVYRLGGQTNHLFDVDDEPSNLCTGDFMGQLSCNRASNVVRNNNGQLELTASLNPRGDDSFFLFDGAKLFTKHGYTSGKATISARQPTGRFLRSMIGLRTLSSNGIDWDKHHSSCLVFAQQTDTLLYKLYDRNTTKTNTKLWSKSVRRFKNLQTTFNNYTVEWSPERVKWSVNNHTVERHFFLEKNLIRKWHLTVQLSVGGPEFTELRNILPDSNQNWPNPILTIDHIELSVIADDREPATSSIEPLSYSKSSLFIIIAVITLIRL